MFQGATQLNLDAKGRLAIPARHREELAAADARLILTAHPHRCLLLFPEVAWTPIRDRILAAPSFDQRSAPLKRILIGNAREIAPDNVGRILIAPELRNTAGLDKQIWMVGMGSHFEIWSEAGWQQQHEAAFNAMSGPGLPAGFEGISL